MKSIGEAFRDRLKSRREELGMTQKQLASLLNIEPPTLNRWEKGHREPAFGEIARLAAALRVSPGYFFGEAKAERVPISPQEALEVLKQAISGELRQVDESDIVANVRDAVLSAGNEDQRRVLSDQLAHALKRFRSYQAGLRGEPLQVDPAKKSAKAKKV